MIQITCEIRDVYGSVEQVGHVDTLAAAVFWFEDRDVQFNQVQGDDDGEKTTFTYRRTK